MVDRSSNRTVLQYQNQIRPRFSGNHQDIAAICGHAGSHGVEYSLHRS